MPKDSTAQPASGQFRLRVPRGLHADMVREARAQGVSLNSYILYLLSTRHSQEMAWQQAGDYYTHRLQDTVREVHEMVFSMTLGEPEPEGFSWRSVGSTHIIAQ